MFQIMWLTLYVNRYYYCCLCLLLFICVVCLAVFASISTSNLLFLDPMSLADSNIEKLKTLAAGNIWPTDDENNDRIESQLRFGYVLAEYLRTHNKTHSYGNKVILVNSPHPLYEPFVSGNQLFRDHCPITNCLLTSDREKFKRTADAVILVLFRKDIIRPFLPKPTKQVTNLSD